MICGPSGDCGLFAEWLDNNPHLHIYFHFFALLLFLGMFLFSLIYYIKDEDPIAGFNSVVAGFFSSFYLVTFWYLFLS